MKIIGVLIVIMLSQINLFAQAEVKDTSQYSINAIRQAVIQYHQQKRIGYREHMVIQMKLMRINKTSGEFALSYMYTYSDYKYLNPTHYVRVNNELVLIIVDSSCKSDPEKFGIEKTTEEIKKEALDILPSPLIIISGQEPPEMVFKYKKNKLKGKFYFSYPGPRKYWF